MKTLNGLLYNEQKKKNFRISKQQSHELVKRRFGQDCISSFFEMQVTEDFNGMIKIVKEIMNASTSLAQLLTFLTYDFNQDGVITEDELTKITNMVEVDDPMNSDVHQMVAYCRQNEVKDY